MNRPILTGVGCRANLLSDRRAEYGLAVHPIIVDVPEVVEEEEAEPAEAIHLAAT